MYQRKSAYEYQLDQCNLCAASRICSHLLRVKCYIERS